MVYQIEILAGALQDAKNCYEFLAESSPENAKKWIDSLMDAFTSLEVMPKRSAREDRPRMNCGLEMKVPPGLRICCNSFIS